MYVVKKIWSAGGRYLEVEEYIKKSRKEKKDFKKNVTTEKMKEINKTNAIKKLTRLMNCNFIDGVDLHLTLSFKKKLSEKKAKMELSNFFDRVREYRKKNNMDKLKYIYSMGEGKDVGIHFHLCINYIPLEDLRKIWNNARSGLSGRFQVSVLTFDNQNGLNGLAVYFCNQELREDRETKKTCDMNLYTKLINKLWVSSLGLTKPKIKKRITKKVDINKPLEYKGYINMHEETRVNEFGIYRYTQLYKIPKFERH